MNTILRLSIRAWSKINSRSDTKYEPVTVDRKAVVPRCVGKAAGYAPARGGQVDFRIFPAGHTRPDGGVACRALAAEQARPRSRRIPAKPATVRSRNSVPSFPLLSRRSRIVRIRIRTRRRNRPSRPMDRARRILQFRCHWASRNTTIKTRRSRFRICSRPIAELKSPNSTPATSRALSN